MAQPKHADMIASTVESASAAAMSWLAASWRRSLVTHGLDPLEQRVPNRIDETSLKLRQSALDRLMAIASPRLDHLFGLVGSSGCCALLTDRDGVVIDQRANSGDAEMFERWGLGNGAVWSEAAEGTNGIGTCLVEDRNLIVHRKEHFFAHYTAMTCMVSPIYGVNGELIGVLDVSSCRPDLVLSTSRIIAAQVAQTARRIEQVLFRSAFPAARIIIANTSETTDAALLAVDEDDIVVGATHAARRSFGLGTEAIRPRPASDLLGKTGEQSGLQRAERAALIRALARAGGNHSNAAKSLGISRATLYRRLSRHDLD